MQAALAKSRMACRCRVFWWVVGVLLAGLVLPWPYPSPQMRLVRLGHAAAKHLSQPEKVLRQLQQNHEARTTAAPWYINAQATVTQQQEAGLPYLVVTPRHHLSGLVIFYLHGGGYVSPLDETHWDIAGALMQVSGATLIMPLYPLAPRHTYQATYSALPRLYAHFTRTIPPARIVFGGESAGGGLALGFAMYLRAHHLPLPARLLLFYPWVDLSMSNPALAAAESREVVLDSGALRQFGKWWAGATDVRDPRLSPLYGPKNGLPPISIYQGTGDLLWPDALKLKQELVRAGQKVSWHEYPGAFHGFLAVPFLPETRAAFQSIRQELNQMIR